MKWLNELIRILAFKPVSAAVMLQQDIENTQRELHVYAINVEEDTAKLEVLKKRLERLKQWKANGYVD